MALDNVTVELAELATADGIETATVSASDLSERMGGGACRAAGCRCARFQNGGGGGNNEQFCGNCSHTYAWHS